ncbi:response regulator [Microvirga massiliensis]|uniref:response regulator n=1 Tax=Microvirga massiliensis TaxID=1033741 RepID=UPI00062B65C0|nr:response regulator [Microvirga massiliensis]
MTTVTPQRILVAGDNPIFRETLAQSLRAQDHDVITPDTAVNAFLALRDRSRPVGSLYARVVLPGPMDGWILADAYHEMHKDRAVILSGAEARVSAQGDIVLKQPTPTAAFKAICEALAGRERASAAATRPTDARQAA